MKSSGSADLLLMGGQIPPWLFERMTALTLPVVESILEDYGQEGLIAKLSDPFWFQSFGAVIGMDWNSSGVTTAVMAAMKKALNPHSKALGVHICGGKGKESLKTPNELKRIAYSTGINGNELAAHSKLSAKVDSAAVQDGYNIYLHNFIVTSSGHWAVIQQGMKSANKSARRYHWHSEGVSSFTKEPHAAICGEQQGEILNLVDRNAEANQQGILSILKEKPDVIIREAQRLILPKYHEIRAKDIDLKRLGSMLYVAHEAGTSEFKDLLLLKGLGPRTLQSLALVSEIIHGAPSRFKDPARFAFAHGGKTGTPFPVPTKVYDETITTLKDAVRRANIGDKDKGKAIDKLSKLAQQAEEGFTPTKGFDELLKREKKDSWKYGGRTKQGWEKPPENNQLNLFD